VVHGKQAIERKGEVEVKEWATYWVVLASLVLLGWLLDFTLSWLPFYFVIKLVFICALWHPSTKWALYVYTKVCGTIRSFAEQHQSPACRVHAAA
jgi:receptor expression-enhancing protein 5/6